MPLDLPRRPREEPLCAHHGPACGVGTRPMPEIYILAIQARHALGYETPPLDEHRLMTPKERKQYQREMGELLAAAKASNDQHEADLHAGRSTGTSYQEEA